MRKITSVNEYQLPIEVVRDGDGYLASCPTWTDCYAQGDSVDEAISEITAVAATLIELYQEEDKHVPLKLIREIKSPIRISLSVPLMIAT